MKEIIINDHQLKDFEIEKEVIRVKALIFNSKERIILAHNNNTYQFPGGHKTDEESMEECILREIREETGLSLEMKEAPFLCIKTYDNDYFGTGKKVLNCIYYYRFFTDELPNFMETQYDELEMATDFNLYYINWKDLKSFLKERESSEEMDSNIAREMLHVIDEYNELFKKDNLV